MSTQAGLDIAYLHYGAQSGVTGQVTKALEARGHRLHGLEVPGPLEWRDEAGRRRITPRLALSLAASALRFGSQAVAHRWNTTYAFDVHARRAGALLDALPAPPALVLQNGALFAPGLVPRHEYVLLLDHTRQLTMDRPAAPEAGFPAPLDYGPGWRTRETTLYRNARTIATFSRRVAESLQHDYGVSGARIHVVGGGANVFPETPVRRDDGRTILFVGKDFRRKGGPVLLRAFQRLRQSRPDLRLLIAGPRERLDLPAGATQLGFVPPHRLADVFAESTVFALPTLREPFGLAFVDAMACGLPCVGTAVEAVPEVIVHHETGLLVPPADEASLAAALESIFADPVRARAMGVAGRARVEERFLWSHVGERLDRALVGRPVEQTEDLPRPSVVA